MKGFGCVRVEDALGIWLGRGRSAAPLRDDAAVTRRFGADLAPQLLMALRRLESDFYGETTAGPAALQEAGTASTTDARATHFRLLHPTASDEVLSALAW